MDKCRKLVRRPTPLGGGSTASRLPRARRTDGVTNRVARAALCRVGLALVVALSVPSAASEPFAQGLLWRLDKAGIPPSWVFGTLHSNDPRVKTLPTPVATVKPAGRGRAAAPPAPSPAAAPPAGAVGPAPVELTQNLDFDATSPIAWAA